MLKCQIKHHQNLLLPYQALAEAIRRAPSLPKDAILIANLSGRGDKDMQNVKNYKKGLGK